jgi:hypothetical protein
MQTQFLLPGFIEQFLIMILAVIALIRDKLWKKGGWSVVDTGDIVKRKCPAPSRCRVLFHVADRPQKLYNGMSA